MAATGQDYNDQVIYYEFNISSGHCFNVEIIDDDVVEPIEDFGLSVHVISSLFPVLVDQEKRNTSIIIVDDDGM